MSTQSDLSILWQYNIGDVVETYDQDYGVIIDRTNGYEHLALNKDITDKVIKSYMNIAIYKALINGKISYVNESNIAGLVQCSKLKN